MQEKIKVNMEDKELDRKLTFWSKAEEYFTDEDGCPRRKVIDFTGSLDACFRWLLPSVGTLHSIEFAEDEGLWVARLSCGIDYETYIEAEGETPAMAFCRTIEKLIEGERAE